jgi:hypothetical protein
MTCIYAQRNFKFSLHLFYHGGDDSAIDHGKDPHTPINQSYKIEWVQMTQTAVKNAEIYHNLQRNEL